MVREYGQESAAVEMCNSAATKILRTIIGTIFSGSLRPRFLVAGQFSDELHRPFLEEARKFAPHDFGAFLLAEEAVLRQSCANHRPRIVVAGATRRRYLRRRLSGKFSQHLVALHADILEIAGSF
jgi:hypothetical protein